MKYTECKTYEEFMDCVHNHIPVIMHVTDDWKVCVGLDKYRLPIYKNLTEHGIYGSEYITYNVNRKEYKYNPLLGLWECSCLEEFLDNVRNGYFSILRVTYGASTAKDRQTLYNLEQEGKIIYDEDLILCSDSYFTNAPFALEKKEDISNDKSNSNPDFFRLPDGCICTMLDSDYIDSEDISKPDNINHPKHYAASNGMEAIDVIESFTEGLGPKEAINTAQVLKYMLRWDKKNGLEDLKKAQWYLNRLIGIVEEKNDD